MAKIGSDLFKIPRNYVLILNLKSDFEKNLKESQKQKNAIFVPCIPTGILFQIKKKIFFFEFSNIDLTRKNKLVLNKKFNHQKMVKIWTFDPTYDH